MSNERYNLRGVSASKEDVHAAIKNVDKGIFPQASPRLFRIFSGAILTIAISCMPTGPAPKARLHTFTGARRETSPYGKELHRMR